MFLRIFSLYKDACENIKCGANAECTAVRHSGQCKCKPGYIGNSANEKDCRLQEITCKNKTNCPNNLYCHNGICRGKIYF